MAKATPERSGDRLAGLAAESAQERVVAQMALAEVPLRSFLSNVLIAYESDEVTCLIIDSHAVDAAGHRGLHLRDGRAGVRRHHAELPEHVGCAVVFFLSTQGLIGDEAFADVAKQVHRAIVGQASQGHWIGIQLLVAA